jgi:hypothetical protein
MPSARGVDAENVRLLIHADMPASLSGALDTAGKRAIDPKKKRPARKNTK